MTSMTIATLFSVIAMMTMAAIPVQAQAASCISGGMSSRSFSFRYVGLDSHWRSTFEKARLNWNNAGVGVSMLQVSTATPQITAGSYGADWYGLYKPLSPLGRNFLIQADTRTIKASAGNQYANWSLSTAAHELGHSLRLADNPTDPPNASLMNHDRTRSIVTSPRTYDLNYVRSCYR